MLASAHGFLPGGNHDIFPRSNTDGTDIPSSLSDGQIRALEFISLGFSAVSISMTLVTFYWFLRMRRSFRHE